MGMPAITMISFSRWSGAKCGKPLKQHSENGGKQIRPELEDLLGTDRQVCLRPHWQREQGEPWIEIGLLAQLLQAQPPHAIHKPLQLLRQLGWTKPEAPVRHRHHHGQMQHLGVDMEKAKALGAKAMLEPGLACICTSSNTTGCSGVPFSPERGQKAPSRRWFAAFSSGASNR